MEVRQDLTLSGLRIDPLTDNTAIDALTVEGPTTLTKTLSVTGASTLTGATSVTGALTVGSDGLGSDVTFYSSTAGDNMLWDASEEKLVITGTAGQNALEVVAGNVSVAGDMSVTGATLGVTFENETHLSRSSGRYYLEEFFKRRPGINGDIQNAAESTRMLANPDFEVLGTNASSDDISFSSTIAGIQLETDGADNDQVIVLPHLDSNQTAWTGIKWGTENHVEWECAIRTGSSIADTSFWAGLKLTNAPAYATDNDQAYFLYASDDDHGALTTNANLHFIYSIGGTDYISDLGIAVAADTNYRLRISIDSSRQVTVFVNGTQYNLTSATTAGGVAVTAGNTRSTALTDDVDLIPYIGVQAHAAAAKSINVCYEKISRILFE